jgi:hypothetical protein
MEQAAMLGLAHKRHSGESRNPARGTRKKTTTVASDEGSGCFRACRRELDTGFRRYDVIVLA